jgi:hypothetical protein
MATYVEVIAASQGLLPPPCPACLWWQGTGGDVQESMDGRLEWMRTIERRWGSVGLVALEGTETVAAVQFAPVGSLLHVHRLPVGPPPLDGVLLYCLRGRVGHPVREAHQLFHQALIRLRERGIDEAYAYARPLGGKNICGVRNLFGLEFLEANGFCRTAANEEVHLMRVSLSGLVPDLAGLAEAGAAFARGLLSAGHPRPAPSPR